MHRAKKQRREEKGGRIWKGRRDGEKGTRGRKHGQGTGDRKGAQVKGSLLSRARQLAPHPASPSVLRVIIIPSAKERGGLSCG